MLAFTVDVQPAIEQREHLLLRRKLHEVFGSIGNQIIGEAIGNILWTKNEIVAMGQKIFASRAKKNPPQG